MRVSSSLLRKLPRDVALDVISTLTEEEAGEILVDWEFWARDEQLPPEGDWFIWLYLAGRGAGKTRAGSEWVLSRIRDGCCRGGLIAPTAADARDVIVEGESGIKSVAKESDFTTSGEWLGVPEYEPSKRRLTWKNGAVCFTYSADKPERLRGPQHDFLWGDELCAWRRPEAWDLAMMGLRLGENPTVFVSTTPKPIKLIKNLIKDPACVVTRGTTYSNRDNLPSKFFDSIIKKYEGTRFGLQELEGVLLEEAEGALWSYSLIEETRITDPVSLDTLKRVVVAVDPAITATDTSDETGIVVCALRNDGHGLVLSDLSGRYSPGKWSKIVVDAFDKWKADSVVAEGNQGGDMVKYTLRTQRNSLPIRVVHASRGKRTRADPIAAYFERKEAHIVGTLRDLEDQLCSWEPLSGQNSPDRLDAMVWGLTDCMVERKEELREVRVHGYF